MLHLRISVPTALTPDVLDVLTEEAGVSELASVPGASLRPEGDLVMATVAREAANDVIGHLHDLGVHEHGALEIEPIPTWMSQAGLKAGQRAPGSEADAVVWAEVTQHAYDDSEANWTFMSLITLAVLLAGIAIILDSQILVIGAMIMGPEFGAITALGLALVRRRPQLLARALRTLVLGFAVAILVACLLALLCRATGWVSTSDVTAARPQTGFIYTPNWWTVVVAMIAASAGVLAMTSARLDNLSGVFVSVTTIPAAANIALGIAFGLGDEISGSALQLLINVVGMALAGWVTLAVQQAVWKRVSARRAQFVSRIRQRRTTRHGSHQ